MTTTFNSQHHAAAGGNGQNTQKFENLGSRQLFVCIGCNTPLFTGKDIVEHNAVLNSAGSIGRAVVSNKTCNFWFVKQREWMPSYGTNDIEKARGILECYRGVCKRKLGLYSTQQGLKCSCGKMVRPAFQIAKNKVKMLGVLSNNVNLGSSTNSLTNLASGSDLGKYMPLSAQQSPYKTNSLATTFGNKDGATFIGGNSLEHQHQQ